MSLLAVDFKWKSSFVMCLFHDDCKYNRMSLLLAED